MNLPQLDSLYLSRTNDIVQKLRPFDDYLHFIHDDHFDVLGVPKDADDESEEITLGQFSTRTIRLEAALAKGFDGFGVCNNHSADLLNIFNLLYAESTEECGYSMVVRKEFGPMIQGLDATYFVDESFLDEPWGPAALYLFNEHLPSNVGLLIVGTPSDESPLAFSRINTLTKLGFVRCGTSSFFMYSRACYPLNLEEEWQVGQYR